MIRGATFRQGLQLWRVAREEFELYREAAFTAAQDETGGALLNARGRAAGIDPWSLFIGPWARARAYASRELLDWWDLHPRQTFEQFEAAWAAGMEDPDGRT